MAQKGSNTQVDVGAALRSIDDYVHVCRQELSKGGYQVEDLPDLKHGIRWRPSLGAAKGEQYIIVEIVVPPQDAGPEEEEPHASRPSLAELGAVGVVLPDVVRYVAIPGDAEVTKRFLGAYLDSGVGVLFVHQDGLTRVEPGVQPARLAREGGYQKCVPDAVLNEAVKVSRIRYSDWVQEFAESYRAATLRSLDEEYAFVSERLRKLLHTLCGQATLGDALTNLQAQERYSQRILTSYRDHLIHSCQVLLLGSVVIDRNLDHFAEHGGTSPELTWVLASVLHDVAYPQENMPELDRVSAKCLGLPWNGRAESRADPLSSDVHRDLQNRLVSLLQHACQQGSTGWDCRANPAVNASLDACLSRPCREWKHGALGALALLCRLDSLHSPDAIQALNREQISECVYPAALAIALHDSAVWAGLAERADLKVTPIDIVRYPAASLLIWCDTVQEGGRPGTDAFARGDEARLSTLIIEPGSVHADLEWPDKSTSTVKAREQARAMRIIGQSDQLRLTIVSKP